jgi:hypothetical protein
MALLAYLVMVALLVTSVFLGFEWIATTSAPRVATYVPAHTRVATRTSKARLAAAAKAKLAATKLAATSTGESAANSVDRPSEEPAKESSTEPSTEPSAERSTAERRTARAHRRHPRIIVQRAPDGAVDTAFGYAAPALRPLATLDRAD